MKKFNLILTGFVLSLFLMFCHTIIVEADSGNTGQHKTITVMSTANVTQIPDIAYINFAIVTRNQNAHNAQTSNANTLDKIKKAFKLKGIEEDNFKTSYFSLDKRYEYDKDENKNEYFEVRHNIQLKTKDLKGIDILLDDLSKSDVTRIQNISYDYSNNDDLYNQALTQALKQAENKAVNMLSPFDKSILDVINIEEITSHAVTYNTNSLIAMDTKSTEIGVQDISKSATVKVTFSFH